MHTYTHAHMTNENTKSTREKSAPDLGGSLKGALPFAAVNRACVCTAHDVRFHLQREQRHDAALSAHKITCCPQVGKAPARPTSRARVRHSAACKPVHGGAVLCVTCHAQHTTPLSGDADPPGKCGLCGLAAHQSSPGVPAGDPHPDKVPHNQIILVPRRWVIQIPHPPEVACVQDSGERTHRAQARASGRPLTVRHAGGQEMPPGWGSGSSGPSSKSSAVLKPRESPAACDTSVPTCRRQPRLSGWLKTRRAGRESARCVLHGSPDAALGDAGGRETSSSHDNVDALILCRPPSHGS